MQALVSVSLIGTHGDKSDEQLQAQVRSHIPFAVPSVVKCLDNMHAAGSHKKRHLSLRLYSDTVKLWAGAGGGRRLVWGGTRRQLALPALVPHPLCTAQPGKLSQRS